MKRLVLAAMMMVLVSGTAAAKDYEVTKKADNYNVVVKMDRNPPTTGNNKLSVSIKDATGADVTDAKVSVQYFMPAMPGMPPMNHNTNAELAAKEYKAKVDFSMSGPWNMVIKIIRAQKTTQVRFTIDAR
jgi:hypothetical protein